MSDKKVVKPVALAVGAALAGSFALTGVAVGKSVDSPFEMSTLESGYMLGATGDKKDKGGEGSCGEGSCGEGKDKGGEGSCGEGSCGDDKGGEGSCGEGSCGGEKEDAEGKCGEGSCGGSV